PPMSSVEHVYDQGSRESNLFAFSTFFLNPVRNSSGASNPAGIILGPNPAVGGTAERRAITSNGAHRHFPYSIQPPCLSRLRPPAGGQVQAGINGYESWDFNQPSSSSFSLRNA